MFLTMINTLRRRAGLSRELFYAYWVNAHAAQIAARLPGIDHLWLHEVDFEGGQVFPRTPGVAHHLGEGDRFEGVPEPCFETEEHLSAFLAAMEPLMSDEANIFDETVAYPSLGDNSRTFRDELPPAFEAPQFLKFFLFLRRADGLGIAPFRAAMMDEVAPALAGAEGVRKLRLHLLEPYDDDSEMGLASAVSVLPPRQRRFDAMVEIAFDDASGLTRLATSPAWTGGAARRAELLAACYPFKVNVTHNLKRDGALTFEGLRTPVIARAIREVGAVSQHSASVRALHG